MGVSLVSTPKGEVSPEAPSNRLFLLLVFVLVAGAILRSAIATRLDSWTQDEDYHTVAGVSYVQRGDFRINPEHPPLVKLWVGVFVSAAGFNLGPFRPINDKGDERDFVDEAMYYHNDFDAIPSFPVSRLPARPCGRRCSRNDLGIQAAGHV